MLHRLKIPVQPLEKTAPRRARFGRIIQDRLNKLNRLNRLNREDWTRRRNR
jgi:hypothetical protein